MSEPATPLLNEYVDQIIDDVMDIDVDIDQCDEFEEAFECLINHMDKLEQELK